MRSYRNRVLLSGVVAPACVYASVSAMAGGEDGDLFFYPVEGDTRLEVGRYDFDGGTGVILETVTEPVIIAELEANWEGGGAPGGDEPGLTTDGALGVVPDGPAGTDPNGIDPAFQFPVNTNLEATVNLLPVLDVDLAYWDGTGPVDFSVAPPHSLIIESPLFPPGFEDELDLNGDGVAPTGTLTPWNSGSLGANHEHFEFIIDEPDATATPGIYLFSMTFEADGIFTDPLYFLAGYADGVTLTDENLDTALGLAEGFVETTIIPEPATAALLSLAGLAGLARRRRRA